MSNQGILALALTVSVLVAVTSFVALHFGKEAGKLRAQSSVSPENLSEHLVEFAKLHVKMALLIVGCAITTVFVLTRAADVEAGAPLYFLVGMGFYFVYSIPSAFAYVVTESLFDKPDKLVEGD